MPCGFPYPASFVSPSLTHALLHSSSPRHGFLFSHPPPPLILPFQYLVLTSLRRTTSSVPVPLLLILPRTLPPSHGTFSRIIRYHSFPRLTVPLIKVFCLQIDYVLPEPSTVSPCFTHPRLLFSESGFNRISFFGLLFSLRACLSPCALFTWFIFLLTAGLCPIR